MKNSKEPLLCCEQEDRRTKSYLWDCVNLSKRNLVNVTCIANDTNILVMSTIVFIPAAVVAKLNVGFRSHTTYIAQHNRTWCLSVIMTLHHYVVNPLILKKPQYFNIDVLYIPLNAIFYILEWILFNLLSTKYASTLSRMKKSLIMLHVKDFSVYYCSMLLCLANLKYQILIIRTCTI